ncbi:MAG: SMC-Scp complex subunit ScpB [Gammaproteobacteria bacterium]|nr:SMC-Scp complex subunit ScpB [Gammaproteobacteria bacterium]
MSLSPEKTKNIIEAALMAAGQPLSIDRLLTLFLDEQQPSRDEIRGAIKSLSEQCDDRGVELKEVSSGFRYQAKQDYAQWVARLWEEKPPRYSRALLETLSLIAYRQPITRGEIEDVRGVSVSTNIMKTLLERDWVKVVGHRDVPGKPAMYATTRQFLDYFNLKNLSDLPTLAEIRDIDSINAELDLVDPGSETNSDASAEAGSETNAELPESIDLAANDAAEEMAAAETNDTNSELETELEDLPPMEETAELKAAPVADTA